MENPFSPGKISASSRFPSLLIPLPGPVPPSRPFFFLQAKVKGKEKDGADQSFQFSHIFSHNQLALILDVLGTPTIDEFHAITSKRSKDYIRSLP